MKRFRIPLILLGILVLYCLAMYFSKDVATWIYGEVPTDCNNDTLTRTGQFGDSAGAINALFSALAFFGVLWALIIQRQDSKITRFENTFFQMLSLQQEIVKDLYFSYEKDAITRIDGDISGPTTQESKEQRSIIGRELFRYAFEEAKQRLYFDDTWHSYKGMKGLIYAKGKEIYENSYIVPYFDHYFRHLYRIIKFVDETDLLPNNTEIRYKYTSIVRAQLSRYELIWIFYICLSGNGITKFKRLVENYSLLKNIRIELLATSEDRELYNKKCEENYIEQTTDFSKEYKRIAFVPEEQPKKKYRYILPFILDINIRIYRTLKK